MWFRLYFFLFLWLFPSSGVSASKPCLLHRPLSVLQSACPSCTRPSTLSLVSLSSFSPVLLSSSLSSLRDLLPSSWRAHTISVFSPLSFWTPALLLSSSDVYVPDFVFSCHSTQCDIHLSILISFTSILDSCRLVVAQVSAPYRIAGLTTVL